MDQLRVALVERLSEGLCRNGNGRFEWGGITIGIDASSEIRATGSVGSPDYLIAYLANLKIAPTYAIGIAPTPEERGIVQTQYQKLAYIIDVSNAWEAVARCSFVISSSLFIVAVCHAVGIPVALVKFSDSVELEDARNYVSAYSPDDSWRTAQLRFSIPNGGVQKLFGQLVSHSKLWTPPDGAVERLMIRLLETFPYRTRTVVELLSTLGVTSPPPPPQPQPPPPPQPQPPPPPPPPPPQSPRITIGSVIKHNDRVRIKNVNGKYLAVDGANRLVQSETPSVFMIGHTKPEHRCTPVYHDIKIYLMLGGKIVCSDVSWAVKLLPDRDPQYGVLSVVSTYPTPGGQWHEGEPFSISQPALRISLRAENNQNGVYFCSGDFAEWIAERIILPSMATRP